EKGVWADDAVEIYIGFGPDSGKAINFAGNAVGAYSDGLASPGVDSSRSWKWEYATAKVNGGWEGELAISFAELGLQGPPAKDATVRFDFIRNDKTPDRAASLLSYRTNWH